MLDAADYLDKLTANMHILKVMNDVLGGKSDDVMKDDEGRKALSEMKDAARSIVDFEIQEAAMKAAAEEIRAMARENKLVEARSSKHGITA